MGGWIRSREIYGWLMVNGRGEGVQSCLLDLLDPAITLHQSSDSRTLLQCPGGSKRSTCPNLSRLYSVISPQSFPFNILARETNLLLRTGIDRQVSLAAGYTVNTPTATRSSTAPANRPQRQLPTVKLNHEEGKRVSEKIEQV